jgi:hypothetical protein
VLGDRECKLGSSDCRCGPARALDLLISARVVRGSEAAELGLVNVAVEDERVLEVTLAYARDVTTNVCPASMATIKRQVYDALTRALGDALDPANVLMLESFPKPDFAEGGPELRRKAAARVPATRSDREHVTHLTVRISSWPEQPAAPVRLGRRPPYGLITRRRASTPRLPPPQRPVIV